MTQENKSFSLKAFIVLSWRHKWPVLGLTSLFAITSVFIVLSLPDHYKAEVLLTPSEDQQGGGLSGLASQFGGLASLAGINLGGKGTDNTLLALNKLTSRQFIMAFIERHKLLVPLMAGKEWDRNTQLLIIDQGSYDVANKKWIRQVRYPKQVKPSLLEAYVEFRELLTLKTDKKAGTVSLELEFYSPILAQQWLSLLVADLNHYMQEADRQKSQKSIDYLKAQIEVTQVAELRSVFYQLVQEQTKKAMLAASRDEFMFETIDAAVVPEQKSKPFRALICVIITLLGGGISLFIVHIRQAFLVTVARL